MIYLYSSTNIWHDYDFIQIKCIKRTVTLDVEHHRRPPLPGTYQEKLYF